MIYILPFGDTLEHSTLTKNRRRAVRDFCESTSLWFRGFEKTVRSLQENRIAKNCRAAGNSRNSPADYPVNSALGHRASGRIVMRIRFDHSPAIEHDDAIHLSQRVDAMRDDESRAPAH